MKLDPNDFQCVKKLTATPEEAGGLSTGVIGQYEDFLNIDDAMSQLASEMAYKLGETINTLIGMPKIPAEAWKVLDFIQNKTDEVTGVDVALEVNAHKMWEDKIKELEEALKTAEMTLAPNRQYLAAELAAKKLSFTQMQVALLKKDIDNQETLVLAEKDKEAAKAWSQKVNLPENNSKDKFNLFMYKPLGPTEAAVQSVQEVQKAYYDKAFINNLKKQTPTKMWDKKTQGGTTVFKPKPVVDDSWDDETENTQLKFLQKIGILSNANVSPQSRVMRSLGGLMQHRLLCDKCKESIPAEEEWITGFRSDQPEIVKFCKDHRHIAEKAEEGRKFRG